MVAALPHVLESAAGRMDAGSTEAIPSSLLRVVKRPKNLPSGFHFFGESNTRDRVQAKSYAKLLLS